MKGAAQLVVAGRCATVFAAVSPIMFASAARRLRFFGGVGATSTPLPRVPCPVHCVPVLAVFFLGFGIAETILAAVWEHEVGVAVGACAIAVGIITAIASAIDAVLIHFAKLRAISLRTFPPEPRPAYEERALRLRQRVENRIARCNTFAKFGTACFVRTGLALLAVILFILLTVRATSKDNTRSTFPESCPRSQTESCVRVALLAPNRNAGLRPLEVVNATLASTTNALFEWIDNQPRAKVLRYSNRARLRFGGSLVHIQARFVTAFWGFAHDLHVSMSCEGASGGVIVEVQSMLRLGRAGASEQLRRIKSLFHHLEAHTPRSGDAFCETAADPRSVAF